MRITKKSIFIQMQCAMIGLGVISCSGGKAPELPSGSRSTSKASSESTACLKMVGGTEKDTPEIFIIASPFLIPAKKNMYELCTATWVSHNWAVTAAHCITDPALTKPKTFALAPRKITTAIDAGKAISAGVQALRVIRHSSIYGSGDDPTSSSAVPNTFNPNNPAHINIDVAFLEFPPGTGKAFLPISNAAKPTAGGNVNIAGFGVRAFADANKDFFIAGGAFPQNMSHKIAAFPANIDATPYSNMLFLSSSTGLGLPLPGDSGGPMIYAGKIIGVAAVFANNPGQDPFAMYASLNGATVKTLTASAVTAGMVVGEAYKPDLSVTGATATIPDLVEAVAGGGSSGGGAATNVTYPNSASNGTLSPSTADGSQTVNDCITEDQTTKTP